MPSLFYKVLSTEEVLPEQSSGIPEESSVDFSEVETSSDDSSETEEEIVTEEDTSEPEELGEDNFTEEESSEFESESYGEDVEEPTIDYEKIINGLYERSASGNDSEVLSELEEFENSTIQVDLYQYTILKRTEFMQYALCIIIALLFLIIFMRYKKD